MYGVPADLPLEPFVGDECSQIGLGRFQLQFRFRRAGQIVVEGKWELCDATGIVVDHSAWATREEADARDAWRIHKIIDVRVAGYTIDAPQSFTLFFQNGYSLTVYDTPHYESFQLNGIIV
jgi:hypothetical protein